MKLRQKLAAALATAMVVTAVPVVTFAATDNSLTTSQGVKVLANQVLKSETNDQVLKLKFEDELKAGEEFDLVISGAEWTDAMKKTVTGEYEITVEDEVATVKVLKDYAVGTTLSIGMDAKIKDDEAFVTIENKDTNITSGELKIAFVSDDQFVVSAEKTSIEKTGTLGKITIKEPFKGAFEAAAGDEDVEVVLELDNDYEFEEDLKIATILGSSKNINVAELEDSFIEVDGSTLTLTIPNNKISKVFRRTATAQLIFTNLKVSSDSLNEGELTTTVSGTGIETTDVVTANIVEGGVSVKVDKEYEKKAGESFAPVITIQKDSGALTKTETIEAKFENAMLVNITTASQVKLTGAGKEAVKVTELTKDDDGNVNGFKFQLTDSINKLELKGFSIAGLVGATDDVTFTIESDGTKKQGITETTLKVAELKAIYETKVVEPIQVKSGVKGQEAGKITITEVDKKTFAKGNIEVKINVPDGVKFTDVPEVKVTSGDLDINEKDVKIQKANTTDDAYIVTIPVKAVSKEASTITISNFPISTTGIAPNGTWDVEVSGTAISKYGKITLADAFVIGQGSVSGKTVFTVGSKTYTVNGVEKTMDAAAYVSKAGRTMVPVRFLADAFGINGTDVMFSNGTVTIMADGKIVQLKNNSNIAKLNGVEIPMDEKVTIIEGRTYAPASQIGNLIGVSAKWDSASQTATFTR